MTEAELQERLRAGEGPLCEFKTDLGGEDVREAVVAFANTVRAPDEAVLFLGIGPGGRPTGTIANADQAQLRLPGLLRKCYPPIETIQYHPLLIEGVPVVAVVVAESPTRPHFTGGAYVRVGSQTQIASKEMFEELIADRTETARRLRPWVGHDIRVLREYDPGVGIRRWPDNPSLFHLESVDVTGLVLSVQGWPDPLVADWNRVRLQPTTAGAAPLVRIAMA